MPFNELNSVEHFIIRKLTGVNLNNAVQATEAEPAYASVSTPLFGQL